MREDDDLLRGSADFRYTCSYSGEMLQGGVIVDVNATRETDWLNSPRNRFPMRGKHRIAPPAVSAL